VTPETLDLIAGWAGLVLTLMIFSYLLGDNALYRVAVHVLVGVAAAYAAIVAVESVLVPWFDQTLLAKASDNDAATLAALRVVGLIPVLVGVLLLLKSSTRLAPLGDLGMAWIIGVGTAVSLVGAVAGTILPLARETGESLGDNALEGVILVAGVIVTLLYFQYLAVERGGKMQRPLGLSILSRIGQGVIALTLGALYAGAILTSLAIFSDVIRRQLEFILDRIGG